MTARQWGALTGIPMSTSPPRPGCFVMCVQIGSFGPGLCRRELLGRYLMAWPVAINGVIVDARRLSREAQSEPRRRDLIPDLPG